MLYMPSMAIHIHTVYYIQIHSIHRIQLTYEQFRCNKEMHQKV